MNYKEILNKLPSSWEQLKLKDYIKLSPVFNDSDNADEFTDPDITTIKHLSDLDKNIQIISLLTDVSVDDVELFTMVQVTEMINKLSFIGVTPATGKPTIKYKQYADLSYSDFITFQKLQLDFTETGILSSGVENLPLMLASFSVDANHNEQYFLEQSIPEVIAGFFTVVRSTEKYIRSLERSMWLKKMKMFLMQIKPVLMQSFKNLKILKKSTPADGMIL